MRMKIKILENILAFLHLYRMSIISAASMLFGGIGGYRKSMGYPIETSTKISYLCVSTPFIFVKGLSANPRHIIPSLLLAPIVNGLIICVGYHIGRAAYIPPR